MKSRNGSYKKILLPAETLKVHGNYLRHNLLQLKKMGLRPEEFTTLYILLFLRIKHPKNWLQKKLDLPDIKRGRLLLDIIPESFSLTNWEVEKLTGVTIYNIFSCFNLKAIPQSINRTMLNWFNGLWNIEMLEYIPIPRELLSLQIRNARCVTVITDPQEIDLMVMAARDPLSFVLHDLMHADQFFNHQQSQKGQLGFYNLIGQIYDQSELRLLLKTDKNFKKEFEYVTTDMNAYVIHLFKCLKSSIYRVDYNFFHLLLSWWNMKEEEKKSSFLLNTPAFGQEDEIILNDFFERNQDILI